jgi:hypothetical protein
MGNFYYWGPVLYKTKISQADVDRVLKLKVMNSIKHKLAGVIENENSLSSPKFFNIIEKYLDDFYGVYEHWYNKKVPSKLKAKRTWINKMGPGDFNPLHTHKNCDFSSVLFCKVDKKLKEENDSFVGLSCGPGSISFQYGTAQAENCITEFFHFPEVGDFFIFPKTLYHFVQPFKVKAERISVACNFSWEKEDKID